MIGPLTRDARRARMLPPTSNDGDYSNLPGDDSPGAGMWSVTAFE
jgi:hypothetical protein